MYIKATGMYGTRDYFIYFLLLGDYYMRNGMTASKGAWIIVENNTKPPNIVSEGMPLRIGTETNIALSTEVLERLKHPYQSNCTTFWPGKIW